VIKVLLTDDHKILREGLKHLLEETDGITVVAEAGDVEEMFGALAITPCDVIVLDITLPARNGLDALREVRAGYPGIPVLILSMHEEGPYAVRALRSGAAGYLTKESAAARLVQAIRKVAAGGKFISPNLADMLVCQVANPLGAEPHTLLSAREFQVTCLIGAGLTVPAIAEKLGLSAKTIGTYRARILLKMGLKNNGELATYAIKNDLSAHPRLTTAGAARPAQEAAGGPDSPANAPGEEPPVCLSAP